MFHDLPGLGPSDDFLNLIPSCGGVGVILERHWASMDWF